MGRVVYKYFEIPTFWEVEEEKLWWKLTNIQIVKQN